MSQEQIDLFQGNYQDPAVPKLRADLREMLGDAFEMRHHPDLFPHDYAAEMCGRLSWRLWQASAMNYHDYVRYCRFASKILGTDLRQRHIRISYELALDVGPTMPEGHNRQQERAQNGALRHVLPKPRPRRALETEHQETASQRFLRRFGAGDTVAPTNTTSRAMKNPLFTASAFPPAYVPSPKLAGGVFSSQGSDGHHQLLVASDFQGAVLVTPPLCLIRETFSQKTLPTRTVKGGSNAS